MITSPSRPLEARAHSAAQMSGLPPFGGQASGQPCSPTLLTPSSSAQSRSVGGPLRSPLPAGFRRGYRCVRDPPSGKESRTPTRRSRAASSFRRSSKAHGGRSRYDPRLRVQNPRGRSEYQLLSADHVAGPPVPSGRTSDSSSELSVNGGEWPCGSPPDSASHDVFPTCTASSIVEAATIRPHREPAGNGAFSLVWRRTSGRCGSACARARGWVVPVATHRRDENDVPTIYHGFVTLARSSLRAVACLPAQLRTVLQRSAVSNTKPEQPMGERP